MANGGKAQALAARDPRSQRMSAAVGAGLL